MIKYNPLAQRVRFTEFINSIFCNDKQLISYVKRALRYALTGEIKEQVFFILYGTGSNGKSTLLELTRYVLSGYIKGADIKTFLCKRNAGIPNDLARLHKARIVSTVETNEGARLDESLIKSITGGDPIVARFLNKEYFEYIARFKLFMAVNHKPHINGVDTGIWRRVRLIPFNKSFTDAEKDKNLMNKLKQEAEEVLAWLVEGAYEWYHEGLGDAEAITKSVTDYREEENYFQ